MFALSVFGSLSDGQAPLQACTSSFGLLQGPESPMPQNPYVRSAACWGVSIRAAVGGLLRGNREQRYLGGSVM